MRAFLAAALACAAGGPAWSANAKKAEHREEALRLAQSILSGGNLQGDLARAKFIGEEGIVSSELLRPLHLATDEHERENLTLALATLASPVAERVLLSVLRDPDPVVRMNAAQGLGRIPTRAWQGLVPLLKDPSMGVRAQAAQSLGLLKARPSGKPLLAAARSDGEPEVRASELAAAGSSGDKSVVAGLASFLTSTSEETRVGAARGLCRLGAPQGFDFARKLLDAKDKYERRRGLELFEGAPAKAAGPVLRPLLKDADVGLAAKAARILYQGGEAVMLDWLVLASFHAKPEEKDAYERELELLQLQDDQRKAILGKAGLP
ncbi:MAG TPA: HEAT repeat domain-containing protein [Myxococcaceae bacterium]|nr:HEAT repeat domain-containing protein [Myxococcaceae bacterium]